MMMICEIHYRVAILFQTAYPADLPYNYYFANGTLIWMVSEDDSFFTVEGELPAMKIRYTPHLDLTDYNIIVRI